MSKSPPRLLVDVTTAFEEAGRPAHGTIRVERGVVQALAQIDSETIVFCRRGPVAGGLVPVSRAEALRIVSAPVVPERRREARASDGPLRASGKAIERWVRTHVRDRLWRARLAAPLAVTRSAGIASPGSVLLFASEPRHEFAQLMLLKRRYGLHLAFVFFDLLYPLPPGDAKLALPDAADIPPTNFYLREASVLLAQSQFSADELSRYAREIGAAMPPVHVIRLASALTGDGAMKPVPGLERGGFVVMVGEISTRKNQELLFAVWRRLIAAGGPVLPLVFAGSIAHEGAAIAARAKADPALAPYVRFLTNVSDEALAWLYANCRFSVFPSRIEGFGLPPVESMRFGKLCITSAAGALPESTQGIAPLLDPDDVDGWTNCVGLMMHDDAALALREDDIRTRFRAISWADTVQDILAGIAAHTGLRIGEERLR